MTQATAQGVFTQATALFALALALAFVVERVLEVAKAAIDLVDSRFDWHKFWTRRAEGMKGVLEKRLRVFQYLGPEEVSRALRRAYDLLLLTPKGEHTVVPVLSGDLIRTAWVRVACKVLGMGLGVLLAFRFKIDLMSMWQTAGPGQSRWYWILLTGAVIGLGAGPVHKIITTIESKRADLQRVEES